MILPTSLERIFVIKTTLIYMLTSLLQVSDLLSVPLIDPKEIGKQKCQTLYVYFFVFQKTRGSEMWFTVRLLRMMKRTMMLFYFVNCVVNPNNTIFPLMIECNVNGELKRPCMRYFEFHQYFISTEMLQGNPSEYLDFACSFYG